MVTFSRTELEWMRMAVNTEISMLAAFTNPEDSEYLENPILERLATIRMEGLAIVHAKLDEIIDSNAKRIAVN